LSNEKNPLFNKEELFLKVLIEGKANLYEYIEPSLKRYFYNKENSNIEQLIFKSYKSIDGKIGENNGFRQQIWGNLKCPNLKMSEIKNLNYEKIDLVNFIVKYNQCYDHMIINFDEKLLALGLK